MPMFRAAARLFVSLLIAMLVPHAVTAQSAGSGSRWTPIGLSGGGGMYRPAVSPVEPDRMMLNCDMSGAYVSADGGRNWKMIHCEQLRSSTRCRPAFHPSDPLTIYAANGWSALSVTHDGGVTWKQLAAFNGTLSGEIAIEPDAPRNILVGVDASVYRSTDGGAGWTKCDGPTGEPLAFHFDQASPANARTCYAGTRSGVWRSDDGGITWARKTAGLPEGDLLAFGAGSNAKDGCILYATVPGKNDNGAYAGGIYRSTDRGESWQPANGAGLNLEVKAFDEWAMGEVAQYNQIATSNANPRRVYAFNTNTGIPPPHHASVYRSDDAGKTWRATFQADPRWQPCNVEQDYGVRGDGQYYQGVPEPVVCATNADRLLLVDDGHVYTTRDGGKTWQIGHTRPAAEAAGAPERWVCNGLVVTTTWNYYVDPFERGRHYICYTDLGFALSTDAGKTWAWWAAKGRAPWTNTCYQLAFDPEIPGKMWGAFSNIHDIPNENIISGRHNGAGPGGVCLSTDFAGSWTVSNTGLPVRATTSVIVDPHSPKGRRTLYAGQFGGGVFKSTDDGKTWTAKNNGLGSADNLRVTRVYLHTDGTLFAMVTALRKDGKLVADGVGLYRSKDGGDSWTPANASQSLLWPKDFTVDPRDSRTIYVGAADAGGEQQGGLWRTTDGGATWKRILRKGPQHFGAYLDPRRPGTIYATLTEDAPTAGLWLSRDNGATWAPVSGLPFANAQRVAFDSADPDRIYVTTFGGSVWHN